MKRFPSPFALVPVVALTLAAPRAARADVTRVWLLRAGTAARGTHLWIEKDRPSDTTGKLHGIVAGRPIPVTPSVPTDKLLFDASGNLSGGTVKLKARTFTDLGGSSLDLKIADGAVLTVDAGGGLTLQKANVTLGLPFGKNGGNQPTLTMTDDIVFHPNGDIHIEVNGGALSGGANKIGLAGFSLKSVGGVHVLWDHKPGDANDNFLCELSNVTVAVPLPGVLAQDDARHNGGIELSASKLTVDGDGNVSADGDLELNSPTGIQVPLAKPMDFVLTVHHFKCSLAGSTVTPKELTADLTLPASFTTDDDQNPDRVTIHGIAVNNTGDLYANETETFSCRWNGFRLNAQNGFTIDLSETQGMGGDGTTEKWEGVKIPQAKLSLPDRLKGANGMPLEVEVTGGLIDEHGFTGVADATNVGSAKVEDFQARLNRVKLTVERGEVMDSLLEGTLSGIPGWDGDLGLKGQIAASGELGLEVSTTTPIPLPGLHARLQVDQGKLERDKDGGAFSLLASGSVTLDDDVDTVGGAIFRFTDLGIDKNGDFVGDRDQALFMELPEPLVKEFGPLTLSVAKVGLGKQARPGETQRRWFLAFDGGAALGGDLPVSLGGDFEGLYVWESLDHHSFPDIDIKGLHVDLGIDNVLTLEGDLRTSEAALPVSHKNVTVTDKNGKPLKYVTGDISVGLPILQTAAPINASLKLLVAPRSWYILGGATTPPIVLGQSGLALGGFFAGIGHNVARYPEGAVGIPSVNYDLIPDPDNTTGRSTPFTITAGARLQTMAPTPLTPALWGDVALVIDTDPLDISLNGNLFLADPWIGASPGIPADPMKFNRVLTGSIGVHTAPDIDFYAHLGVDLNFPTRQKWVIRETGNVDLALNKTGFSALMGGPISADRNNHTVDIQNPFSLYLNLPGLGELSPLEGALTFVATPTKGGQPVAFSPSNLPDGVKANLQAAAKWRQSFSKTGDADIKVTKIHYEASGTIDLEAYFGLEGALSAAGFPGKTVGSFAVPALPAPSAYFYGDAWAKASVENAKIEASKGPFSAGVTANLTGWMEGQLLFYYGGVSSAGGVASFEGDITGSVSAKLFKTWTFPVSAHQKIETSL